MVLKWTLTPIAFSRFCIWWEYEWRDYSGMLFFDVLLLLIVLVAVMVLLVLNKKKIRGLTIRQGNWILSAHNVKWIEKNTIAVAKETINSLFSTSFYIFFCFRLRCFDWIQHTCNIITVVVSVFIKIISQHKFTLIREFLLRTRWRSRVKIT